MDELIRRAKFGDQSAMNEIFDNYKGLIRSVANNFYLVGGDKDDLLQEGMVGLFHAVTNFDENKGSFPAFVKLCVARQVIDAVKRDNSDKNRPLKEHIDIANLENMTAESTPLGDLLEKEFSERIEKITREKLTSVEQKVIKLFVDGYSYEDIATRLQITYKAVDGAMQRARKKLLLHLFKE